VHALIVLAFAFFTSIRVPRALLRASGWLPRLLSAALGLSVQVGMFGTYPRELGGLTKMNQLSQLSELTGGINRGIAFEKQGRVRA